MAESVGNGKRTAEIAENDSPATKKSKIEFRFEELNVPSLNAELLLRRHRFFDMPPAGIPTAKVSNSGAGDLCSDDLSSSRCCSNETSEVVQVDRSRFLDLEAAKSFETESSTGIDNKYRSTGTCSTETTPSGGCSGDSENMDSPPSPASEVKKSRRKSPEMPAQAEIEEFFAVAERNERTRFTEKYNYDVVKDVPLEGRFQWVRLKP